ncbi:MAG TPA: shikimate kinase [Actinocatenispora sp.]
MSDRSHGLRHVFWLGGGSGSGKSTVARHLAARYGLALYDTDAVMSDHARRSTPDDSPYLHEFMNMDMDQRWLLRTPETMLDTFHWFRGEGFDRIVEDLLDLPDDRPVIAEGFRLLPHRVAPLLADRTHAVWLLPTPDFREVAFDSRGTTWQIARRTSRPEVALHNLLVRERLFTDRLTAEVRRLDLPAITVDGTLTEADLTDRVARGFGLG